MLILSGTLIPSSLLRLSEILLDADFKDSDICNVARAICWLKWVIVAGETLRDVKSSTTLGMFVVPLALIVAGISTSTITSETVTSLGET